MTFKKTKAWCRRTVLATLLLMVAACGTSVRLPETPVTGSVEAPQPPTRAPRLGLALGGGAARGFAHVGVIQVLEQNGIRADVVAGTSVGSMVAAMYASGKTAGELEAAALSIEEAMLTDWSLPIFGRGVLRGEALTRYVRQSVGGKLLENMKIPLGVLATDLATGQGVLFRRGDAAQAVRASSAVPGVFAPVSISGRDYVDGGLVAPVPVRQARDMGAEVVLAVDISSAPEGNPAVGSMQVLLQTFAIMGQSINRHELGGADLVVRPALTGVGGADFSARLRSIEAGRAAMQAALPQLKALLVRRLPAP
ncbi:patatin-like phospholipase family protein [Hydrogenophaga sp. BPS33]|uniref:patatin-like phospholipase family protein n=1 Tax=Hydrogenophaga sp. BPS33 TaxID=2651974 RepID=UPI00131F9AAF|nr:patatin-like phospholipase family protein [Hydrogenophaga sp. BPS33]QHE85627.1 patatin-like phospholipase family protein [Hydrogenophaga sp. BPS33]